MNNLLKHKLTEKDIEKIVNGVVSHLKESIYNPFSMPYFLRNNPLMEGCFETYPIENIEKYLKKRYGEYANVSRFENENGIEVFLIGFYNDVENENLINKDMALCGYFPSLSNIYGNIKYIQYEPRHQDFINDKVQDEEYIYHLTPTNKVSKIMKLGLIPKTNNKLFKYPDRIYFFLHEPDTDDCLCLMEQFYKQELVRAKENRNYVPYNGSYTLLAIDTEKIKNVNFSYDPNAFDAIYTVDNISPSAIEIVKEVKQNYTNNK